VLRSGGRVIATAARFERSADPRRVASAFRESGARPHTSLTVRAALDRALGQASPEDLVLITGSLYVVGEARALLLPEKYRNPVLPGHV
jgi:dihydrofolate synthase/folylpolyglutamate synthase